MAQMGLSTLALGIVPYIHTYPKRVSKCLEAAYIIFGSGIWQETGPYYTGLVITVAYFISFGWIPMYGI